MELAKYKGHLHDKCDRITEFHLPEAESPKERISKRYRPVKSPIFGHF